MSVNLPPPICLSRLTVAQFYLNRQAVTEASLNPDLTLLDYLREQRRKCGTKEGCASGDCGACTVVLARVSEDGSTLQYDAVNSCITFAGAAHGAQVICVEDLQQDGQLHPAQQAMVDCHGSQCGFCTPGFVMSLFALYKQPVCADADALDASIEQFLGGNLCRCTGYRPIIDAARRMLQREDRQDQFDRLAQQTIKALTAITPIPVDNGYYRPATVAELCRLRSEVPAARLVAGATDLALEVTQQLRPLEALISVKSVTELNYFRIDNKEIKIGAGLSLADLATHMADRLPDITALLLRFGSQQVRNNGSVGGNIANASPIGDLPPVFLALQARVVLQSVRGSRELALADFFIDYRRTALAKDEIVAELIVPDNGGFSARPIFKAYKISKRHDDDISAVCAVFSVVMQGDTIQSICAAFGGMAAIPKRAPALEQALRGRPLSETLLQQGAAALATDFQPITDMRASAAYRKRVSENLLIRLANDLTTADRFGGRLR